VIEKKTLLLLVANDREGNDKETTRERELIEREREMVERGRSGRK